MMNGSVLAERRAKNREAGSQQKAGQWTHRLTAVGRQQLTEGKIEACGVLSSS